MKRNQFFLVAALVAAISFSSCGKKEQVIDITEAGPEVSLFNGVDLDGWGFVLADDSVAPEEVFYVKDSVIHIAGTPFGYMYTKEKYDNFYLQVEWRWVGEATNSGIFLFVQDDLKVWPNAIECQLCAGKAGDFVLLGGSDMEEFTLEPGQERPAFPIIEKRERETEKSVGAWNKARIICQDGEITVIINGMTQNVGNATLHKSGRIALQSEGKDIEFRNIWIKKIEK